ncbi:DNA alkylation repair protein [Macrococcoides canis]|uniref:DNA alkylation repair protein n=1 Tax=Macrococcoides canis TaxID=1855823 RepID=UPI001F1E92BF|nr:DNA alkylation repair protein [Macrococcus canis]UJS28196.1 DNA alkylation repair protein [Macrococcus canis]UTH11964.1 DNA alkylation repair protein [Macrococcus canis]WBF52512.1 DNA alkylation repair protein [Macrococcus canis]
MLTIEAIKAAYEPWRNEVHQAQMEKYMKHQFKYLGIKKTETTPLMRELFKDYGLPRDKSEVKRLVSDCFDQEAREYHYIGMIILNKSSKFFDGTDLEFIKSLILTHTWWDSVDTISPNILGDIVKRSPEVKPVLLEWCTDENFWLRRAALLHQLKFKQQMDTQLLEQMIEILKDESEFFIRKAIGWILREYSKTDADYVINFVNTHELSNLSTREALKWLNNRQKL